MARRAPVVDTAPVAGVARRGFSLAYRGHVLTFLRGMRIEPDPAQVAFMQAQDCPVAWETNDVTE